MARKRGKKQNPQQKTQANINVKEKGLQNNKMNSDAENPQNVTRNQKSSFWDYTKKILDGFISGLFRLQLFFYQKAAGRLPLFLKEENEKSGQEITQHTTENKELKKTLDQLKAENKELTVLQKNSAERIKELEEDLQKHREVLEIDKKRLGEQLEKEYSKLKDKEQENTITENSLRKAKKELDDTKKKLCDASKELDKKEQTAKQAASEIEKKNDDIIHLKTEVKSLKNEHEKLRNENKSLEDTIIFQNQTQKETEQRAKERIQSLERESNNLQYENNELYNRNALLTEQTRELEAEKQDALKRLSEQVSVRLRDNNPNIVDLSDQCRPTKLAEMFSELYDNEWTNAYSALEDTFTEEHSIVILLDTVMLAYRFCENKLSDPWQSLVNWLLDPSIPGAQQTAKWLKDSRKANVPKIVPDTTKDFCEDILKMCGNDNLKRFLNDTNISEYFIKCIELCLLMTATDPPIVLVCPGWKAPAVPQTSDFLKQDQAQADLENEKESCSQSQSKHVEEIFDINEKEEKSTVDDEETTGDKDFQSDETTINENAITELGDSKYGGSFTSMMKQDEDNSHKQEGQQKKGGVEEIDEKKLDHRDECKELQINEEDQETDRMISALRVGDDEHDQQLQQTHLENAEESSNGETYVVGDSASELKPPQSEDHMRSLSNPEIDDNSGLNEIPVREFGREILSQTGNTEAVRPDTGLHESEEPGAKIVNKYQDQGISQKNNEMHQQKHQNENEKSHDEGTSDVETQQEQTMTESDKEATPVVNANQHNADEQMDNFVIVTHDQITEEGDQSTEKQHKSNDIEKDDNVRYDNNLDDDEKDFEQHLQPQDDHEKQENSDVISVNNEIQEPKFKESQHSEIVQHMDFGEIRNENEKGERITDEKRDTEGDSKQKLDQPTDSIDPAGEEAQNISHDEEDRELNTTPDLAIEETRLNVCAGHNQQENGTSVSEDESTKQEKVTERQVFDKNTFKEYTKRGKYIDYIVWPAMSLYENGELLSKGVAQGSKEQFRKPETEEWTWVKP